jgi:hypothetical protein
MVEELQPVTDTQDGHSQFQDLPADEGGVRLIDAPGATGQDDAPGGKLPDLVQGHEVGMNLAIDMHLPDAPGNELGILGPEIQNEDLVTMGINHGRFTFVGNIF